MDVRLLGAVRVHGAAGRVELGPRRQRFVFAILALEANQPVPVDRLIELAWATDAPRTAEHAIEVCVSRLRRTLSPADARLIREGRAYVLKADPETVDVHRFHRLVRQAAAATDDANRVAVLTEALDLWSGPPLADVAPEDVVDRLCRGLTHARWSAVEDRFDARLRLGQHGQVLGELAGLTGAYPGRERLVAQHVTALYRCGRAAEALTVCRNHRAWLAGELGLDPGVELQRLEVAVLRNDPALAAPVPATTVSRPTPRELPGDLACFVGRREELAVMSQRAAAVVALSGTAGVGKTTLAVRFAHQVADRFPDGQLYINLRGFGGGPMVGASVALRQLVTALGAPAGQVPAGTEARARLFRSLVAGLRILVVRTLARTYSRSGDDRAAFEHASRSLAIHRQLGRHDLVPSAANAVGWYAARIGEHDTAAASLSLALTAARSRGDRLVESDTLHSQGYLAQRMQRHEEAIALLRQCLRLARTNGDAYNEATSLRDLGNSYAALGRPARAVQHWRRALPLLEAQARWSEVDQLRAAYSGIPFHS